MTIGITGRYRWALWSGWALTILGAGLLKLLGPSTSVGAWIGLNLAVSAGTGVLFPAGQFAIQAAIPQSNIAFAVTMLSFLRTFGQSLGVAVGGVIFQNTLKQKLEGYPLLAPQADAYSQDATALVQIIQAMPTGEERAQLVQAYSDSLGVIWLTMLGLAAVAGIASLFTKEYSLNQEHVTNQGYDGEKRSGVDAEAASDGQLARLEIRKSLSGFQEPV